MMKETFSLCGTWTLEEASGQQNIPALVPGSVLSDLLNTGIIEDPFWRENEYETLRLFDRDYRYTRTFTVPPSLLARENIDLVFYGLDTLADVSLNGTYILYANNMHRTWRVNVKPYLLPAQNTISILFHSPNRFIEEAAQNNPDVTYDGTGTMRGTSFLRKAHCMFGWDWGPQLPDAGIWRPCELEGYDFLRIRTIAINQYHDNGSVSLQIKAITEGATAAAMRVSVCGPEGNVTEKQGNTDTMSLSIDHPRLWQPNGWGQQPLYTVTVSCLDDEGNILDSCQRRIGLRTIHISREQDEYGEEFCLKVNGRKMFAMGADYIPEDNILSRTSPERTYQLLADCAKSNFNTVRVWGGGYYPEDWFFDQCDELGLIVWLDLMYACNVYKLTEEFEQNIVAETRDNLERIRHHACIGLLCGNNEMETAWTDWPAVANHSKALQADYIKQFEYVLRKECASYAPQIDYWPSSPSSGGCFDDPNSYDRGDVHYWDVWHGLKPFSDYQQQFPRFCSEFGFESFPSLKTVKSYTLPEDRNVFSRVMESHQKCVGGNGKILYYISQNYQYPLTFEHLLYASQLLQAEAMRAGVEHWRRYRGRCMGAIYWQLNDCWPVASWASIDSSGRWKQLQYAARKFFAPQIISCERNDFSVRVNVANDTLSTLTGKATLRLIDAQGQTISTRDVKLSVPALTAQWIFQEDFSVLEKAFHAEDNMAYVMTLYDDQGQTLSENCELFSPPKFFRFCKPNIRLAVRQQGNDCKITVSSDVFAWGVWLETQEIDSVFSDNGFFLLPGETKTIIAHQIQKDVLLAELAVTSVADIGR